VCTNSDPITQFAAVFSGLIHDVDHRGVPNFILVKEEVEMADQYKGRSVAEQNSVDKAWKRLMEPDLKDLRRCIYTTPAELRRFRQTVVNTIMATDIFDKDCAELRKRRWDKCFHSNSNSSSMSSTSLGDDEDTNDRKATIICEHLMQASDVAHTMQHWSIYQKWNQRLFEEMYKAHKAGRMMAGKNPAEGWYESELSFFDSYVIPLAKKLKECGVFGVSSDEYLNYAMANREEWSIRGRELVKTTVDRLEAQHLHQHVGKDETEQEATASPSSSASSSL
jgi:3'5'-cyclic nucleotide phosphodiesterase